MLCICNTKSSDSQCMLVSAQFSTTTYVTCLHSDIDYILWLPIIRQDKNMHIFNVSVYKKFLSGLIRLVYTMIAWLIDWLHNCTLPTHKNTDIPMTWYVHVVCCPLGPPPCNHQHCCTGVHDVQVTYNFIHQLRAPINYGPL